MGDQPYSRMREYEDEIVFNLFLPARLKASYVEGVRRSKVNTGDVQQSKTNPKCQ